MAIRSLFRDLREGEAVSLDGGRIVVSLEHKSGQRARLKFALQDDVSIERAKPMTGALQAQQGLKLAG